MKLKQQLEQLDERCIELALTFPEARKDAQDIRVCLWLAISEVSHPQEDTEQFLHDCIEDTRTILANLWEFYESGPDTIKNIGVL